MSASHDVAALGAGLEARGLRCAIESRGALAVLTPLAGAERLADDGVRREVVALARECGFSHVALELLDCSPDGAALRRD